MLLNLAVAAFLVVGTTAIHACGMAIAVSIIRVGGRRRFFRLRQSRIFRVSGVVLIMFFASVVEVLVYAAMYLYLEEIQVFEEAFYFSMVTFTTLGYGEIVLDEQWRLLASFEAGTGIIMFGWTTAIVLSAVQHIYFGDNDLK